MVFDKGNMTPMSSTSSLTSTIAHPLTGETILSELVASSLSDERHADEGKEGSASSFSVVVSEEDVNWWKHGRKLTLESTVTLRRHDGPNALRDALNTVREKHLARLLTDEKHVTDNNGLVGNDTQHVRRTVRLVVRLVQLLCTMALNNSKQVVPANQIHDDNENMAVSTTNNRGDVVIKPLSEVDLNKMAVDLLLAFSKAMCSWVRRRFIDHFNADGGRDHERVTNSASSLPLKEEAAAVAQFSFLSLLRCINPHVRTRPFLLPPLWRGLCDIASVLPNHSNFSHHVIHEAVVALNTYINEGEEQTRKSVTQYIQFCCTSHATDDKNSKNTKTATILLQQHQHYMKLLVFLLARLGVLLPILLRHLTNNSQKSMPNKENTEEELCKAFVVLARLRGLAIATQILVEQNTSTNGCHHDRYSFLQPLTQLGQKVEQCLTKFVFMKGSSATNTTTTNSRGAGGGEGHSLSLHRPSLRILLGLTDNDVMVHEKTNNNNEDNDMEDLLLHASFALGKLTILRYILDKIVTSFTSERTNANTANVVDDDVALCICEDILFLTLPLCHDYLATAACSSAFQTKSDLETLTTTHLLTKTIHLVVDCMLLFASKEIATLSHVGNGYYGFIRIHRVLVRWLAPDSSGSNDTLTMTNSGIHCSKDETLHPLIREVTISVVCTYILRLYHYSSDLTKRNSNTAVESETSPTHHDPYRNFVAARHIISLLSKLLFHRRTSWGHRRNITALLLRLLGRPLKTETTHSLSDDAKYLVQNVQIYTRQIILEELNLLSRHNPAHTKKRKRRQNKETGKNGEFVSRGSDIGALSKLSTKDILVTWPIIERIFADSSTWSTLDDAWTKHLQLFCKDVIEMSKEDEKSTVLRSLHLRTGANSSAATSLFLAILCGIVSDEVPVDSTSSERLPQKSELLEKRFIDRIGSHIITFQESVIDWLIQLWKNLTMSIKDQNVEAAEDENTILVAVSCVRFIRTVFSCMGNSSFHTTQIRNIHAMFVVCSDWIVHLINAYATCTEESQSLLRKQLCVLNEVVSLLASIGSFISPTCSQDILMAIASVFNRLLSDKHWPIVASTMSSLEKFASTLPANHQGILPMCIPVDARPLLQSRLKGKIHDFGNASKVDFSSRTQYHGKKLFNIYQVSKLKRWKMHPCTSSVLTVPPSSSVFTLKTRDGKSALLIIPPGDNMTSQDISEMIEGHDGQEVLERHTIKRVFLTECGAGCQFKVFSENDV